LYGWPPLTMKKMSFWLRPCFDEVRRRQSSPAARSLLPDSDSQLRHSFNRLQFGGRDQTAGGRHVGSPTRPGQLALENPPESSRAPGPPGDRVRGNKQPTPTWVCVLDRTDSLASRPQPPIIRGDRWVGWVGGRVRRTGWAPRGQVAVAAAHLQEYAHVANSSR